MVNLKFWKKDKNDFETFGTDFGGKGGAFGPAAENPSFGVPEQPQNTTADMGLPGLPSMPTTPSMGSTNIDMIKKDIEVLNSKMDSLRATLDAINQKLINIEGKLGGGEKPVEPWHY